MVDFPRLSLVLPSFIMILTTMKPPLRIHRENNMPTLNQFLRAADRAARASEREARRRQRELEQRRQHTQKMKELELNQLVVDTL
jgi:hypothetical protein